MRTIQTALVCGALLAICGGSASARQAGHIYLECGLQVSGHPGTQAYRIGGGQWDFMANPDWEALEWVNCGEQRQRDNMLYTRTCTFNDRAFKSEIRVTTSAMPWSALIVHEVDRYTGTLAFAFLTVDGVGNRSSSASCRVIPEPKPGRKF